MNGVRIVDSCGWLGWKHQLTNWSLYATKGIIRRRCYLSSLLFPTTAKPHISSIVKCDTVIPKSSPGFCMPVHDKDRNTMLTTLNDVICLNVINQCKNQPCKVIELLSCDLMRALACRSTEQLHHHHYHHLSLNREGRSATTDEFTTSFLHFPLFSTALWNLANSRSVNFLKLPSHLFLCLPCLLPPFTMPCKMVWGRSEEREIWPYHCSLRLFTMVRRSSCGTIACWILARTSSLVTWPLY